MVEIYLFGQWVEIVTSTFLISEQTDKTKLILYGENTKDQRFGTNMLVSGATYTKPLNETSFIKSTTCINIENQKSNHDTISRNDPNNFQITL
jgi:hypothetical protein